MRIILISIKIAIVIVLIGICIFLYAFLKAETKFHAANKASTSYRWQCAEKHFLHAIRLDPFNANYYSAYADFILTQNKYKDNKVPLLKKAKTIYEKAVALNGGTAEYLVKLGQIDISLFMQEGKGDEQLVAAAFKRFRQAASVDPNGFNTSYLIGRYGFPVWNYLGLEDKEFVLDRIRCALKISPGYASFLYPLIWEKTRDFRVLELVSPGTIKDSELLYSFITSNNLWQFRKIAAGRLSAAREKENYFYIKSLEESREKRMRDLKARYFFEGKDKMHPDIISQEDWRGMALDGKNEYKGGAMYWGGIMEGVFILPTGETVIYIEAKGTPLIGVYPYMIVELDGKWIGELSVNSQEFERYEFQVDTAGGAKALSVTFLNDAADEKSGEDRNLFIKDAGIVK